MGMIGWIVAVGMARALLVGFAVVMAVVVCFDLRCQFSMTGCFGGRKRGPDCGEAELPIGDNSMPIVIATAMTKRKAAL